VTACFTPASVANLLPYKCLLSGPKKWELRGLILPSRIVNYDGVSLVEGYGPPSPSPNFATVICLLGPRKEQVAGKRLATDAGVKQGLTCWLHALDTDFF